MKLLFSWGEPLEEGDKTFVGKKSNGREFSWWGISSDET